MVRKYLLVLLAIFYIGITSWVYLLSINLSLQIKQLHIIYPDVQIEKQLQDTSVKGSLLKVMGNRFFHNVPFSYGQAFLITIYRNVDPVFLFSLSPMSSMYDNPGSMQVMYPIEVVLFALSAILTIRQWKKIKTYGKWIGLGVLVSLIFIGVVNPSVQQLKVFPLVVMLRIWFCFILGNLLLTFPAKKK